MIRCAILLSLVVLLGLSCLATSAPNPPEHQRQRVALDGEWQCAVDTGSVAPRPVWAKALPDPQPAELPHSWAQQGIAPQSVVWYSRTFTYPETMGTAGALLVIENAVGVLEVYVDGALLATQFANGLPYRLRLEGTPGTEHLLTLRLDGGRLPDAMRRACRGIGPLWLEMLPVARVDAISPVFDLAKNTVTVRYRLSADEPVRAGLRLELYAPGARRPSARQTLSVDLPDRPLEGSQTFSLRKLQPWSPADPRAYRAVAALTVGGHTDTCEVSCGAAAFAFTGQGPRLNGTPLQIKGLHLPGGVPALTHQMLQETIASELSYAKRAGFNAIMPDGAALPEDVLTAADRLGLIVLADLPVTADPAAPDDTRPDIAAAVAELAHHPCIAAWSWDAPGKPDRDLAELRALDPFRPALARNGVQSQAFFSFVSFGDPFTCKALALPLATDAVESTLQQIADSHAPVLADVTPVPEGGATDPTAALQQLRTVLETVRASQSALGYVIRPLPTGTLTGLTTLDEALSPFFTLTLACNQPHVIALRVQTPPALGRPFAVKAQVISEGRWKLAAYDIHRIVTVPGGMTTIDRHPNWQPDDSPVQNLSDLFPPVQMNEPGEYRVQYLLTEEGETLASAQVTGLAGGAP